MHCKATHEVSSNSPQPMLPSLSRQSIVHNGGGGSGGVRGGDSGVGAV